MRWRQPVCMYDVMRIGLSGLEANAARFGAAANRIVNAMHAAPANSASNQNSAGQQNNGGRQNNPAANLAQTYNQNGSIASALNAHAPSYEIDLNPASSDDNLPRDIAAMKMASVAYRANLQTVETARKMFDATLDILA